MSLEEWLWRVWRKGGVFQLDAFKNQPYSGWSLQMFGEARHVPIQNMIINTLKYRFIGPL